MPLQILNGPIIAAGESLSAALDCTAGEVVRLTMPAQWTPANIEFQISSDGLLYNDLVGVDGRMLNLTVVPGSAVVVQDYLRAAVAFLKIRSARPGWTRNATRQPVIQAAQRQFAVAIMVPG